MTWLTMPQAPVSAGQSGHLNDHNLIALDLSTLWGAAAQGVINVAAPPYSADTTGVADATTAVQNAVNAAWAAGGVPVYFPPGTYKLTPVSSSVAAITMNNGTTGFQNMRLIGAGQSTILKKNGTGPLLDMAGPSTDVTGATHCRFCSIESMQLNGNANTGALLRCYYADDLVFRDVQFISNPDVALDTTEFWDSRFFNCVWQSCGSTTANASTPNVLLRNSAAASGYGASTDNVNQIHFVGCRWEGAKTGSLWVQQGVSNSNNPNGIFVTDCKMETSAINNGPHLLTDANCKGVYVNGLYCYSGGFTGGYSTAQDVITWSAQDSAIENVFIANKTATATVANGITLNSTVAGQNSYARNITAIYNTAPTGAHVNFGTATGGFVADNCTANTGTVFAGTIPNGAATGLTQTFTSSGTWTKPPGATTVTIIAVGGGGGGGSGAVEASGTVASGGAGGGGGAVSVLTVPAAILGSTETVTVGTGGSGGAAVGTSAASGNAGNAGTNSNFRSTSFLVAGGGQPGAGGSTGAASGGSAGTGTFNAGAGASSSSSGAAGSNGTGASNGAPGGGSGGGVSTTPAASGGGTGGAVSSSSGNAVGTAGSSGGGTGGAGTSVTAGYPTAGTGGGGGGSATAANGGAGGAGGAYGAGGGGGGGALTTHNSGAGGNGGAGIVVVVTATAT